MHHMNVEDAGKDLQPSPAQADERQKDPGAAVMEPGQASLPSLERRQSILQH